MTLSKRSQLLPKFPSTSPHPHVVLMGSKVGPEAVGSLKGLVAVKVYLELEVRASSGAGHGGVVRDT
jgi:hypothetical protein